MQAGADQTKSCMSMAGNNEADGNLASAFTHTIVNSLIFSYRRAPKSLLNGFMWFDPDAPETLMNREVCTAQQEQLIRSTSQNLIKTVHRS